MPARHGSPVPSATMNLQQLRYLVATADEGTMTRAARACHVAQPALTRAVRSLERELGTELLTRHGRGVELSPTGRLVVEAARRILAEVSVIEGLGRRQGAVGDVLTIAATPTIQADLGSGLIQDFWRRHPEFPVRFVHCESRQHVGDAVASGAADVGVSDLPAGDGMTEVEFEWREVIIIAPPGYGLPEPLPVAALGDLPMILPTKNSLRRVAFDLMFAELGIAPTVVFESDERASWLPAVLSGVGCCVWYRIQGEAGAAFGAEVRSLEPALRRPVGVVHRPGPVRAPVAALVALAAERAAGAGL
jgi:DNA-binding transcriptional LysR family regulator